MAVLKLEDWPLDKLVEYEFNPRKNDHAVDQMCAAIVEMGFKVPIIAKSNGHVVDGHLRLKAARKLALDSVPVILADDLSETQIKAFRILVNQSAHWADWDMDLLKLEMQALDDLDFDLDVIGFSDEELDELLGADDQAGETDEDDIPEVEEDPISRPGDIWVMGNHRVLCGDSTSKQDLEKLMNGELADMAFTDPPYNVDYGNNAKDKMRSKDRRIMNDNLGDDFYQFLKDALTNLLSVTKGACYIAMSSSELDTLQKAFRDAGGKWSTFIVWAKNTFTLGRSDYQRQYEPILYGWREGNDHFWCGARDQGDVWFFNKPVKNDLHPTMKPVELVERALRNSSKSRDIVLDLFGGSGSTLIACEKTGRAARLIELDPKYVDVIVRRWQDYSGEQAIRESDKLSFDEVALSIQSGAVSDLA
ncbi:prophage LambdaMc01, DNA methyltransferase [methanotrophic bacterial endosymbiont of Bathymodiolus sp.]|jgi:DNA modification methylase|nr:prophage LambdaMc01, DNA methyltransferase [methanotrophic bacterial endosymbiont of Bathymodiolus sp.]